jgi:His-Xaa-Ser system radical SAM maturase HxsC
MVIQLRARGFTKGLQGRTIGRVSFSPVEGEERSNTFRAVRKGEPHESFDGYLAAIFEGDGTTAACPSISGYESLDFLKDGYVVAIESETGFTRVLYRHDSRFNTIFATDDCNSNCLMCSQPPKKVDESEIVECHLRHIDLIPDVPERLGITGGEPTLLGDGLVRILGRIKQRFPESLLLMLSNGRMYSYEDLVQKIAAVANPNFTTAIPLYASTAPVHDYVVQAKGAFDQTIQGLYNAAKHGLKIEIRVVLHKQTIPGLMDLMEYIYRNLPFVDHVALMGLENMGYVKKNWELLWIDPLDYAETLERAVRFMWHRRIHVSVYNLPLCVVPKGIWSFARQSISDYKNIYLDECEGCNLRMHCSGLFLSGETRHSRGIKAVKLPLQSDTCR